MMGTAYKGTQSMHAEEAEAAEEAALGAASSSSSRPQHMRVHVLLGTRLKSTHLSQGP